MNLVFLALGSNLGDSRTLLRDARDRLTSLAESPIASASLYETIPVNCPPGSPSFLNTVVSFSSKKTPSEILAHTQAVESELGRAKLSDRNLNAPRPIDLDLIFVGNQVIQTPDLTLPHPRFHERRFVLHPLRDLAPGLVPPTHANPIAILLEICESQEPPPIFVSETW